MWTEFKWCLMFCLVTGVLAFIVGQLLPSSWFAKGEGWWFTPRAFEHQGKIYEKIGIRQWKDKLPDMSKRVHRMVSKSIPTQATSADTTKLIRETCVAEVTHEILMITGFVCYAKFRSKWSLFLSVLWSIGNLPFVLIQRYNRPRLIRLRDKQQRHEQRIASTPDNNTTLTLSH